MTRTKHQELLLTVMEMIDDTLQLYKKDPTHAPAEWLLENWWNTLSLVNLSFSLNPAEDLESPEESC